MSTGVSRTPIIILNDKSISNLYVKREDMIPYSFGGNKARKAELFFADYDKGGYDYVVTYGTSHSNHCRVIANICAGRDIPCLIVSPNEVSDTTYNSKLTRIFGAEYKCVPVEEVHDTIETELNRLRAEGHNPYFIEGGGHGNIGTDAYVRCYDEICEYESLSGIRFDYIFFASGTGTTQAGLVCGQLIHKDERHIVGISIARKNPRGRQVILDSIISYMDANKYPYSVQDVDDKTVFIDDYTSDGYGADNAEITDTIREALRDYGMPLDSTYTGKAFYGMKEYIKKNNISDKNILFIHTGGTPLFFDDLENRL